MGRGGKGTHESGGKGEDQLIFLSSNKITKFSKLTILTLQSYACYHKTNQLLNSVYYSGLVMVVISGVAT